MKKTLLVLAEAVRWDAISLKEMRYCLEELAGLEGPIEELCFHISPFADDHGYWDDGILTCRNLTRIKIVQRDADKPSQQVKFLEVWAGGWHGRLDTLEAAATYLEDHGVDLKRFWRRAKAMGWEDKVPHK